MNTLIAIATGCLALAATWMGISRLIGIESRRFGELHLSDPPKPTWVRLYGVVLLVLSVLLGALAARTGPPNPEFVPYGAIGLMPLMLIEAVVYQRRNKIKLARWKIAYVFMLGAMAWVTANLYEK